MFWVLIVVFSCVTSYSPKNMRAYTIKKKK